MNSNGICRNPYYDNHALYTDLCYKKNFNDGFNEEPFQLFINPKKFYCAQISGLQANEMQIIDNSVEFPEVFCVIIELITYQRYYSKKLCHILSVLNKIIIQNSKYNSLTKAFIPKLTMICKGHQNLSHEIDKIAFSQNNSINNFSSCIIKKVDFYSQLQEYNDEVKKNESLLIDISLDNSAKESLNTDQLSIIQMLKSSKSWYSFYIQSIQKMSVLYPADDENSRHLCEISKVLQCFLNKI